MTKPSALETMRNELLRIQSAQHQCIDKYDIVKPHMRERYLTLTKEAEKVRSAIEVWHRLFDEDEVKSETT